MNVYILRLYTNKFYVGKAINLNKRIEQHKNLKGSLWTTIYPFEELVCSLNVPKEYSSAVETKLTCKMILKSGLENVRGAEIISPNKYSKDDIKWISLIIGHNLDLNFNTVYKKLIIDHISRN